MSDDPEAAVAASHELDREIEMIVSRKSDVISRRTVYIGFCILTGFCIAILSVLGVVLADTRQTVDDHVVTLQQRNIELTKDNDDLRIVVQQAVDAIILMSDMLIAAGIDPPEVILRPPDEPKSEDGD